jgi:hypothetical protein
VWPAPLPFFPFAPHPAKVYLQEECKKQPPDKYFFLYVSSFFSIFYV